MGRLWGSYGAVIQRLFNDYSTVLNVQDLPICVARLTARPDPSSFGFGFGFGLGLGLGLRLGLGLELGLGFRCGLRVSIRPDLSSAECLRDATTCCIVRVRVGFRVG